MGETGHPEAPTDDEPISRPQGNLRPTCTGTKIMTMRLPIGTKVPDEELGGPKYIVDA